MRTIAAFLLALALLLLPALLAAQQPDAPEPAPAAQPGEPQPEPPPEPPPEPADRDPGHRPYESTEFEMENMSDVEIEAYQKIAAVREDSIKKMENLIETTPNYANIADIYYRIAEFRTENIKFKIAMQAREYRRDMERYRNGELKEEPVPPRKDYSSTLPYYERILIEHPKYPRVEEVLFYLGRNGVETGKALGDDKLVEKSIRYLDKLEQLFPQSQFLPQAYLMSGEYFFAKKNLFEALKYYKKLTDNHKDAPMYLYALYKLGWTYYNYQQFDKTLECYQEVIQKLREQGRADDTLRQVTLKDYLVTVSEAGLGFTQARDFLKQEVGEEQTLAMMRELAPLMATHGFYADAIGLYSHFISLDPNAAEAVGLWNEILNVYRFNYPFEETEAKVKELRFFFRGDGPWVAANQANAQAIAAADDLLVKWDLSLAEYYLENGLYFNKGDDPFYLAIARNKEILEKGAGKRQEQAWAGILLAYMGLVRNTSKGKVIYVAENVLGLAYPDDYKLPRPFKPQSLDKNEVEFMKAKEQYLGLPEHSGQKPDLKPLANVDMKADILYTSALIYYMRGQWAEGLRDIDALIAYDPKSEYLGWAGEMTYEMSARAEDWSGLERRMSAMVKAENFRITPPGRLKECLCTGMIEAALDMAEKKQYGDALTRLSTAATTCADNADKAGEALYRLGETAEAAGFVDQARDAYKKVLDDHPKSKYKAMAARKYDKLKKNK